MKMSIRLGVHFILSFLIWLLALAFVLMVTMEVVFPLVGLAEKESTADRVIILVFLVSALLSSILYGWFLGRPLLLIVGWIEQLARGDLDPPEKLRTNTGENGQLRFPYRLYNEVFEHMRQLTDTLKRNERERKKLDEMKREWVAGISHDLKTPLTYITGYSAMLLSDQHTWSDEEKHTFMRNIHEKGIHMQELIQDLSLSLQMNDAHLPLQIEETDMVEFIRRLVADVGNDPRARDFPIRFHCAVEHHPFFFDAKLLQRALHNLMMNAIIHNPPGTPIHVLLRFQEGVELIIADYGVGMDEETLEHLFQKYFRGTSTDQPDDGTGLGMAIARGFILAHGGDIQVTSQSGKGTTVRVILPRNPI
ncbi:sensor histidine kinase [Desmospora profundinema]|uniref:histidine kinase n=1 Tax=Desmospora profundinema TaxID=1571184 RepID=A0ABU1IQ15_9BACL|nr:HAMP domain-containing sensor histidine kinase [Desmospora profundinema]MDR6226887.1 signal transduction histidine kinase [Desmospora profundinema]